VVYRCRHRHEQAGAVDGNNFSKLYICVFLFNFEGIYPKGGYNRFISSIADVSSAISLTDSGLSQYSISSLFILP